jgi:hypothetical protein
MEINDGPILNLAGEMPLVAGRMEDREPSLCLSIEPRLGDLPQLVCVAFVWYSRSTSSSVRADGSSYGPVRTGRMRASIFESAARTIASLRGPIPATVLAVCSCRAASSCSSEST